jgi:glucose-1-phosphate adenylyltransferase
MGLLGVNPSQEVERYAEKPGDPEVIDGFRAPDGLFERGFESCRPDCYLASMGIYLFNTEVLVELLGDPAFSDFGHDLLPAALERLRLMAYPFNDYWRDIGTIPAYYQAHQNLVEPDSPFALYSPGWPFYTRARSLPPCKMVRSEIHDSLVAEGADVTGASISKSVIGLRSVVRPGSKLNGVVLLGNDYFEGEQTLSQWKQPAGDLPHLGIGRNCLIERAIVDKNARLGDGVIIRGKRPGTNLTGQHYWVQDGITVVTKGAVIPPGTEI